MSDFRRHIDTICEPLPGAVWSDPWGGGHDAWKVGDKMFACMGSMDEGVSVKTRDVETATMLIDTGVGERAPYFHRSWIRMRPSSNPGELTHRIHTSYDIVRSGLSKKLQATLAPRETN